MVRVPKLSKYLVNSSRNTHIKGRSPVPVKEPGFGFGVFLTDSHEAWAD